MTINLEDGRKELFQWDTGRTLDIEDPSIEQVHFSNSRFGTAIVVTVENGLATIPDELLQTPKQLHVWAFVGGGQCGYTKIERVFSVAPRNKPANYVHTPVKQDSLYALRKDLGNLDELETQSKESMVAAVNELRKEEDLLREMADGAVKTINGVEPDEDGNVEITAGIQADWSQNDETAPDYIKNRPGGYISTVCEEPEEYSVTFATDTSGSPNGVSGLIIERIPYVDIEIDGTKYENVPVNYDISVNYPYMGDPKLETYPFVINYPVYWGAGAYASYCYATEPGEKTVVITKKTVTTVKIPMECLDIEDVQNTAENAERAAKLAQNTANGAQQIAMKAQESVLNLINLTGYDAWTDSNISCSGNALAYGNGTWVLGGGYYSADGRTWVKAGKTAGVCNLISFNGNNLFVATGSSYNKKIYYSGDGKTWTAVSNIDIAGGFNALVCGGGAYVACSNSGNGIYYSANGKTWKQVRSAGRFTTAAYANDLWVVCGDYDVSYGLWYITNDGSSFAQSNIAGTSFIGVAYSDDVWIAYGDSGVYYSEDGMVWTKSTLTSRVATISYANGLWVCGGSGIYYSTDGKAWKESNVTSGGSGEIVYEDNLWVCCSGVIYYSVDGKTWTESNVTSGGGGSVTYANGIWVTSTFYCSADGKVWKRGYDGSYKYISHNDGVWVAAAEYTNPVVYCSIKHKYVTNVDVAKVASTAKEIILTSSTEGSTKRFHITVDDSGTLSATEVTTEDND